MGFIQDSNSFVHNNGVAVFCFTVILSVGIVFGNALTIIAVSRTERLRVVTNAFIVNLAIADIIVGIATPYQVVEFLPKIGHLFLKNKYLCIFRFATVSGASFIAQLSLLSIAVERYIYFNYPLHFSIWMTRRNIGVFVIIMWVYAMLIGLAPFFSQAAWTTPGCNYNLVIGKILEIFWIVQMMALSIAMSFFYLLIFKTIRRHRKQIANQQTESVHRTTQSDWKGVKMLLTVFGAYIICWTPLLLMLLIDVISVDLVPGNLRSVAAVLAACNSGMNFIIYAWRSADFRKAYKSMFVKS